MYLVVDADVDGKAELVAQDDVSGDVTASLGGSQRRVRLDDHDALVSQLDRQHHRLAAAHRLHSGNLLVRPAISKTITICSSASWSGGIVAVSCSARLDNTLLNDEESARDNHVLARNFAKYSLISEA